MPMIICSMCHKLFRCKGCEFYSSEKKYENCRCNIHTIYSRQKKMKCEVQEPSNKERVFFYLFDYKR